jgi:hypothetical protein
MAGILSADYWSRGVSGSVEVGVAWCLATMLLPAALAKGYSGSSRSRALAFVEGATALAVLLGPVREAGFAAATALGAGFVVFVARLDPSTPCNCYGRSLETFSRGGRLVRAGAVLAAGSTGLVLETAVGPSSSGLPLTAAVVGAVLGLALVAVPVVLAAPQPRTMGSEWT